MSFGLLILCIIKFEHYSSFTCRKPEVSVQSVTVSILCLSRAPEMTWYQPAPQTAGESALHLRKTMVSSELQILHSTYGIWPLPVYRSSIIITTKALTTMATHQYLCYIQFSSISSTFCESSSCVPLRVLFICCLFVTCPRLTFMWWFRHVSLNAVCYWVYVKVKAAPKGRQGHHSNNCGKMQ